MCGLPLSELTTSGGNLRHRAGVSQKSSNKLRDQVLISLKERKIYFTFKCLCVQETGFPGARVAGGNEPRSPRFPHECWEPHLVPLELQKVLLMTETDLDF